MQHVEKAVAELEKLAESVPEFKKACDKNGVPAGYALGGILSLSGLILLWF
jgi:hypothetical protein